MQNKLKILQIGSSDWSKELTIPDNMNWYYFFPNSNLAIKKVMEMDKIGKFDAILVDDLRRIPDLFMIESKIIPYTVFYDQEQETQEADIEYFLKRHCAQPTDMSDRADLLRKLSKALFSGQYGDKMTPLDMVVSPGFRGKICYNGYENLELEGDFGQDFQPVLSWKYNVVANAFNPVELWLEYEKEGNCELRLLSIISKKVRLQILLARLFSQKRTCGNPWFWTMILLPIWASVWRLEVRDGFRSVLCISA